MAPQYEVDRSPIFERRRWSRVRLSVPVQLRKWTGEQGRAVAYAIGRLLDVSTGGACVATEFGGPFVPEEIVAVSITIPWEARRGFPFSLIEGACRVVRIDRDRGAIALSFCPNDMTILAAALIPR